MVYLTYRIKIYYAVKLALQGCRYLLDKCKGIYYNGLMLIGIFGGAFDPFHKEHKELVKAAWQELNLDKILIIPTAYPPHKIAPVASFTDRKAIIKAECKSLSYIEVSDAELTNKQGYTYLLLKQLQALYPKDSFVFIIGADSLLQFEHWKRPQEIAPLCTLAVAGREGYPDMDSSISKIKTLYGAKIIPLKYKGKEISSTRLRASIELGLDVGDILGEEALEIIKKRCLYKTHAQLVKWLKANISKELFAHTQRVVLFALELNAQARLSFDKVFLAALLHDVGKTVSQTDPVGHQYTGEQIAIKLGIKDADILQAIKYHTTAHKDIDALGKIVYLADKLEVGRDYQKAQQFRALAKQDYSIAFEKLLEYNIDYLTSTGVTPDANSISTLAKIRRK